MNFEYRQGDYWISTDPSRLDVACIHRYLSQESYWAIGRSYDTVLKTTQNSLCFGVYHLNSQAGFARVVTDYATFAWLCDVFILPQYRGLGLSKWLVKTIVDFPELNSIRRFLLASRDAGLLYQKYGGFTALQNPERWMERFNPNK